MMLAKSSEQEENRQLYFRQSPLWDRPRTRRSVSFTNVMCSFIYGYDDIVLMLLIQEGHSPLQKLDEILEDPMTTQDGVRREIDGRCNRDGDYDLEAKNIKTSKDL